MLAASDRFIITCIGKSIKNNAPVPFITPLAEFVDMCLDADSSSDEVKVKTSRLVFDHPRHAMSSNNFIIDKVVPGMVWGHNGASFTAGSVVGTTNASQVSTVTPFSVEQPELVTIEDLINVLDFPEDFFFKTVGVSKWVDKVQADTALLPIDLEVRRLRELWNELRELSEATSSSPGRSSKKFKSDETSAWQTLKKERGAVPVGILGDDALGKAQTLLDEAEALAKSLGIPNLKETEHKISLQLPNGVVEGSVSYFETDKSAGFAALYEVERLRSRAAVLLLLLVAKGIVKDSVMLFGYDAKNNAVKANIVFFEEGLTQDEAMRRLAGLIDAIHIARTIPAVEFAGTMKAIFARARPKKEKAGSKKEKVEPKREKESPESVFDKFVASDKYAKSTERRLFGEEPLYLDIFAPDSPIYDFWLTRTNAVSLPVHAGNAGYEETKIRISRYDVGGYESNE
jgi:exonuclease V gamma subunit